VHTGDHVFGTLVPIIVWGLFIVAAVRRWSKRRAVAATPPIAPLRPAAGADQPFARRRLAPPQAIRPVIPVPAPARPKSAPSMAETLPAEAAAAFPGLDLSLPGADVLGFEVRHRRRRSVGGGPPIGSPAWAANAIVANEILGPPVSLRSGATLGAPHAF
jgi:hypothetical protein